MGRQYKGALTVQALVEHLQIWDLLVDYVTLQQVQDQNVWKLTESGTYSCKSVYNTFFVGSVRFAPWNGFGNCGHRGVVSFLCGWQLSTDAGGLID